MGFVDSLKRINFIILFTGIVVSISGILFLTPSIHGNDGVLNFVYLRSVIEDGDLDFTNDFEEFDRRKDYTYKFTDLPRDPHTQHYANRYGIGASLLWSPFYLLFRTGHAIITPEAPFDSFGSHAATAISIGTFLYALCGLLLLLILLRRYVNDYAAAYGVIFIFYASPLAFYTLFHPSMSHVPAFFLIVVWLTLYLGLPTSHARHFSLYRWLLLGVVTALVVMTRFQDVVIVPLLAIGEIVLYCRTGKKEKAPLTKIIAAYGSFCGAFIIAFLPQMIVWNILFGSFFSGPAPYLEYSGFNPLLPRHIFQVLFSPRHGLFYWHPFLFIGVIAIIALIFKTHTKKPEPSRYNLTHTLVILSGLFLVELYLTGCWQVWHAGASFGQRLMITAFPTLAFGLAIPWAAALRPVHRIFLIVLLGAAIAWNVNLVLLYGTNAIPHQAPVTWTEMLTGKK